MVTLAMVAHRCAALAAALALVACGLPGVSTGDDAGSSSSSGSTSADGGARVTGAGCGQDPQTGTTLCAAVSSCPNLVIDTDQYPGCGFRVHGDLLDMECVCNDSLCPIGIASTCAQAKQLLDAQNVTAVCTQVNEGRCAALAPAPASSSGSSGSSGAASSCDRTCASECAGDPGCIRICGC